MGGFFGWLSINITYIFFCEYRTYLWIIDELMNCVDRGLQYQGIDRRKLHYWNPLQVRQDHQNP
jgi:amino acid transporter